MRHENISGVIIDFCNKEKIHFNFLDPNLGKRFIFYNKKDALKVLSYLFKNYKKYYYHLDIFRQGNKKIHSYKTKIFIEYDDYLFNCVQNIKYYYIRFDSYIYIK